MRTNDTTLPLAQKKHIGSVKDFLSPQAKRTAASMAHSAAGSALSGKDNDHKMGIPTVNSNNPIKI